MEKDPYYWRQHKEVYLDEIDKLDSSILNLIQKNPKGDEAQELELRVHRLTTALLPQEHHA
jgi:hypothetical protein